MEVEANLSLSNAILKNDASAKTQDGKAKPTKCNVLKSIQSAIQKISESPNAGHVTWKLDTESLAHKQHKSHPEAAYFILIATVSKAIMIWEHVRVEVYFEPHHGEIPEHLLETVQLGDSYGSLQIRLTCTDRLNRGRTVQSDVGWPSGPPGEGEGGSGKANGPRLQRLPSSVAPEAKIDYVAVKAVLSDINGGHQISLFELESQYYNPNFEEHLFFAVPCIIVGEVHGAGGTRSSLLATVGGAVNTLLGGKLNQSSSIRSTVTADTNKKKGDQAQDEYKGEEYDGLVGGRHELEGFEAVGSPHRQEGATDRQNGSEGKGDGRKTSSGR